MTGNIKETQAERVLRERVEALEKRLTDLEAASGIYATDKDLAGQYGDPVVKFSPRDFRGPDFKNKRYSQCSPEFLDVLAEALSYSAANPKPGSEKFAKYNLADSKRARSWARRLRSGWRPDDAGDIGNDVASGALDFEPPAFEPPKFEVPDSELDDLPF